MKIQTLSVLCGTEACDARCPFCVSRMTYEGGMGPKPCAINTRNLDIACQLAERAGVTTAMLTGKGEPTLWPEQVEEYLAALRGRFPLIELQTNGIGIGNGRLCADQLKGWYYGGLTTVCLSVVHWARDPNHTIYLPHLPGDSYPRLDDTIELLHAIGFSVRLNCIMLEGWVDCWEDVDRLILYARDHGVEQLTLMPVNAAGKTRSNEAAAWAHDHRLTTKTLSDIRARLEVEGHPLMDLAHGARVFDHQGQNVCLSNCLSTERYTDKSTMRNLIFFPDGHLRYDWEHEGAILL
jgi:molybdenum cofactor biosynthesis enzyme MoaA